MIGVMASAVVPGRIGEPTRIVVLSRRLEGSTRRLLPIVAGTVFSQTLINLLALAILASRHVQQRSARPRKPGGGSGGRRGARWRCACSCCSARACCAWAGARARCESACASASIARLLALARQGLVVFVTPRHGIAAVAAQLCAWTLQWLACYAVHRCARTASRTRGLAAAAAVLLAVNVSAVLPATPSNVGRLPGRLPGRARRLRRRRRARRSPTGSSCRPSRSSRRSASGSRRCSGEGMTWRDIRRPSQRERRRAGRRRECRPGPPSGLAGERA